MDLTTEQRNFCDSLLGEHMHKDYTLDIPVSEEFTLPNFKVRKGVLRPEKTSGLHFTHYLAQNPHHYKGKRVFDMGSGSGIQTIVMGLKGAEHITASDILPEAYQNTLDNVRSFDLSDRVDVFQGDLFEKISKDKFDFGVFNHPFWPGSPSPKYPVTKSWRDEGSLLKRFLKEASTRINPGGYIIMPFFSLAGDTNNPEIQAPLEGYKVDLLHSNKITYHNFYKMDFSIFKLTPSQ
ncbi:MAG: methyltransferase [Nanoarchaeota archaeon]